MNAEQRAKHYLRTQKCYQNNEYKKVDEWIAPTVELMNETGYITLYSCSGHEDQEGVYNNQCYVMFVATVPVKPLRQTVSQINKRLNIGLRLYKVKHMFLRRLWIFEVFIEPRTSEQIKKINEEISLCLNQQINKYPS